MNFRTAMLSLSLILFLSAFVAIYNLTVASDDFEIFILVPILMQLLFSGYLFCVSIAYQSSDIVSSMRMEKSCYMGLILVILLTASLAIRQYNQLGFNAVLPITTILYAIIFSLPFLWALKKVRLERNCN